MSSAADVIIIHRHHFELHYEVTEFKLQPDEAVLSKVMGLSPTRFTQHSESIAMSFST